MSCGCFTVTLFLLIISAVSSLSVHFPLFLCKELFQVTATVLTLLQSKIKKNIDLGSKYVATFLYSSKCPPLQEWTGLIPFSLCAVLHHSLIPLGCKDLKCSDMPRAVWWINEALWWCRSELSTRIICSHLPLTQFVTLREGRVSVVTVDLVGSIKRWDLVSGSLSRVGVTDELWRHALVWSVDLKHQNTKEARLLISLILFRGKCLQC